MVSFDFGNALSGGLSGAAIGSAIPGVGSLAGGAIGGIAGLFGGSKKKRKKVGRFDKQQQQLYQDQNAALYGQGPFSDLYNYDEQAANQNFEQMYSRPAYRQFQENVIPGITGSFRGRNLQNSSYAGEALGRAGRDVQESLDAQRANVLYSGQQAAQQRKAGGLERLLGMQTFGYEQPQESGIDSILRSLAPLGGDYLERTLRKYRAQ